MKKKIKYSDTVSVLLRAYVYIPPVGLDNHWEDFIMKELTRLYKDFCLPNCGFITDIHGIHRVDDFMITSITGQVHCHVDFYATVIRPQKGTKISGRVDLVSDYGIILSHPYISILVPARQMKQDGYDIKTTFSSTVYWSNNHTITPHSLLTVELLSVRFENHQFSAVGKVIPPTLTGQDMN